MFIQDWIYFVKVAECHSINRAAEELYRTYQGIYKSIARLEQELGGALFYKNKNLLQLTDFGNYVKTEFADRLIDCWKGINNCAESYRRMTSQHLRIGLSNEVEIFYPIDEIIELFRSKHPLAEIETIRGSMHENWVNIENNLLDIALTVQLPSTAHLNFCPSIPIEWYAFVDRSSDLAGRDYLTSQDLKDHTLLFLLDRSILHRYIQSNFGLDSNNFIVCPTSNPYSKTLMKTDFIVRIASIYTDIAPDGFYDNCVRIPFSPPLIIDVGFVYKTHPDQKKLLSEFVDFFTDEFKA